MEKQPRLLQAFFSIIANCFLLTTNLAPVTILTIIFKLTWGIEAIYLS